MPESPMLSHCSTVWVTKKFPISVKRRPCNGNVVFCFHARSILHTVLDIKRVENSFFHTMYIFSVILHAIDKHDISK